jgi:hypothetical protein
VAPVLETPEIVAAASTAGAVDAGVIEEARARQRRRQCLGAALSVAAAGGALVVLAVSGGGASGRGAAGLRQAGGRPVASGKATLAAAAKCVLARPPHPTTVSAPTGSWLAALGVLRRPQRTSDAIPRHAYLSYNQEVFVRYIRRARVVGGSAYWVWPAIITRCGGAKPYEGLMFFTGSSRTGGRPMGGSVGETLTAFEQYGDFFTEGGRSSIATVQGIVPDGVASVTLHYPATAGHPARQLTGKVVENVAVISVPFRLGSSLRPSMTWTGRNGRIIKMLAHL